jgi:hypothetical protein
VITPEQIAVLCDIFNMTEALDKITLVMDATTRHVVIMIEDLDDEWFRELTA